MRQSLLFSKTIKEAPKEEISVNAQILARAGFVDKLMTGVYSYLPLGFLVLRKIEEIIRQEMNRIGGQEIFLPALHPKANWQQTKRWGYPEMFKLKNREGKEFGLGWTHEEIITPLARKFISSYKDLPVYVYQIQDKFRDELRAKSGLLRGVEFLMKDLYSFHRDEKDLDRYYEKVKAAYLRIFRRCGLKKETYLTLASGGTFSKYSHEFQTMTSAGEDTIYLCSKCELAINKEIIEKEKFTCPKCGGKKLEVRKTIEIGNIFKLKNKFSGPFKLVFKDEDGKEKEVFMGCYGIGLGRLMGTIAEIHHDDKGLIWPKEVAPFRVHLISLTGAEKEGEKLYRDLLDQNIEVMYDDRKDKSAGEKFAEADLIGIPLRIVVSGRTLQKNCLELKKRGEQKAKLMKIKDIKKCLN
jgi:prolyl-tRNA synthetase